MMIWPVLLSGFTLGAVGSLHCVGMCGPLSLALPVHRLSASGKFLSLVSYQAGRILTYSLIGLVFGIVGRRIYITGYQQWFSIVLGILVLLLAILYFSKRYISVPFLSRSSAVSKLISHLLAKAKGPLSFFLFGMANGLLPCGMVYIALLATLSFTEIMESVGFMAMFGLGTLPAMMMASYAIQSLKWKNRVLLRQMIPYFIVMMGILLILRGMNLGIPFISPEFPAGPSDAVTCHP